MHENDQDDIEKLISDLYSETSQEKPSSVLDDKILSEARKELQQTATDANDFNSAGDKSAKRAGLFTGKWSGPVSLAAVIVLSVTVVVTIEKERPYSLTSPPDVSSPTEQVQKEKALVEKPMAPMAKVLPQKNQSDRSQVTEKKLKETSAEKQITEPEVLALQQLARSEPEQATRQARAAGKVQAESSLAKRRLSITADAKRESEDNIASVAGGKNEQQDSRVAAAAAFQSPPPPALKAMVASKPAAVADEIEPVDVEESVKGRVKEDKSEVEAQITASVVAETASVEPVVTKEKLKDNEEIPVEQLGAVGAASVRPDALMIAPAQTFASGSRRLPQRTLDNCSALPLGVCLTSKECTLEPGTTGVLYRCRAAENQCEANYSQAIDTKDTCEAKPGCKYQPAKCFCPPGIECICGGGPPAMCVPEKVGG